MSFLVKNSFWNAFFAIFSKSISFIVVILIARNLSIQEYSMFGSCTHKQVAITLLSAGYIEIAINKSFKTTSENKKIYKKIIFSAFRVSLIFFALFLFVIFIVNALNLSSLDSPSYILAMSGGIIGSYLLIFSRINRLEEKHMKAIALLHFPLILSFVLGIFLIFFKGNYAIMFFIGSTIGFFISLFILIKFFWGYIKNNFKVSIEDTLRINKEIRPYQFVALLGWIGGYGNVFIIKIFLEDLSVAKYTFLYTLGGIMLLAANSLNQVWSPYFYRISKTMKHSFIENTSYSYYTLLAFILSAIACLIVLLFKPLLMFFGGNLNIYSNYVFELALVFGSFIIYTPVWHCRNHLYLKTDGVEILRLSIFSNLSGLIIMILLIYFFKDIGIYIGLAALSFVQVIFFCHYTKKSFNSLFAFKSIVIGIALLFIFSLAATLNLSYASYFIMITMLLMIGLFFLREHLPKIIDVRK